MNCCSYYQAQIVRKETLFFVAILRSFDHLCFDRTLDPDQELFEFFVPQNSEQQFLNLMHYFEQHQIVLNLKKLPNRLLHNPL